MPKKALPEIRPVADRVVVRRVSADATTPGGIALPDNSVPTPRLGTVIAVGPGGMRLMSKKMDDGTWEDRFPMQVKVGDRVLLPHMAEVIRLDPADPTSEVVVCLEGQILAVLD